MRGKCAWRLRTWRLSIRRPKSRPSGERDGDYTQNVFRNSRRASSARAGSAEADRDCHDYFQIAVARKAYRGSFYSRVSLRGRVAQAEYASGFDVRGSETVGGFERDAREGVRVQGLSDDCRDGVLRRVEAGR